MGTLRVSGLNAAQRRCMTHPQFARYYLMRLGIGNELQRIAVYINLDNSTMVKGGGFILMCVFMTIASLFYVCMIVENHGLSKSNGGHRSFSFRVKQKYLPAFSKTSQYDQILNQDITSS